MDPPPSAEERFRLNLTALLDQLLTSTCTGMYQCSLLIAARAWVWSCDINNVIQQFILGSAVYWNEIVDGIVPSDKIKYFLSLAPPQYQQVIGDLFSKLSVQNPVLLNRYIISFIKIAKQTGVYGCLVSP